MSAAKRQHVVIRREEWVAGTRERPEVGVFTQTHAGRPPVPWGHIAVGERVWMKWSGGPIVARATVQGFRQIENCTSDELRETTSGFRLYDLTEYWESRQPSFYGMTVYLQDEEWLDEPIEPAARSRRESWVIIATPEEEVAWLAPGVAGTESTPAKRAKGRTRTVSPKLRFTVLRRDGFTCTYCGRQPPAVRLQVDHVIPWSRGGSNHISNLRTACAECNVGKGARKFSKGH